ncbi:MAG: GNAT family N-acetyltransferase [Solirubrobacteraceae bacterium MAG38_C4-C5]|nr:GNAT family N-acetyltransferase [Candidatus Siliceabacter maunaloa]
MRFPLSLDLLRRLPRHPDWKYELIDGEAVLSSRPRPLGFRRPTDMAVAAAPKHDAEVRAVEATRDRAGLVTLLLDVWSDEDPYRSFEEDVREAELRRELERTVERPEELEGAVALDTHGLCAGLLVMGSGPPALTWLSVRRDVRGRGLATALLSVVVDALAARGEPELGSYASAANVPSVRWHLACGFALTPDRLRELLRRDGSA